MQSLFEEYRPRKWEQLIGHRQMKAAIYLIAGDVCEPDNFIELDSGDISPTRLEELERHLRYRALGDKPGRSVLINEAHGLRRDTIRKLLVVLERIPNWVTWVFTTTSEGQQSLFDGIDAHPLISRCVKFDLRPNTDGFAEFARRVADDNGLGGATPQEYVSLIKDCKNSLREALCRIEAGAMIREERFVA